jgi:hypothetical protein
MVLAMILSVGAFTACGSHPEVETGATRDDAVVENAIDPGNVTLSATTSRAAGDVCCVCSCVGGQRSFTLGGVTTSAEDACNAYCPAITVKGQPCATVTFRDGPCSVLRR